MSHSAHSQPKPRFISEPIRPEKGSFSPDQMSRGLASLPHAFTWRGRRYEIVECLEHLKQSAPEGGRPDGERYLRRQQFTVKLSTGQMAVIYCQRQARPGAGRAATKQRWHLFTLTDPRQAEPPTASDSLPGDE